ncbi:MAG: hypothetical protein M5R36_23950 [Deltaproteobacteria bacterium]|nr:hypothetical protein [Deltaproteobacteria bacterium]
MMKTVRNGATNRRAWLFGAALLLGLLAVSFVIACTQDNEEDDDGDDTRRIPILVLRDDLYNFQTDDVIGRVEFRKYRGPVGSLVEGVCRIDRLSRFEDVEANVKIFLRNQDAARISFEPVEWVQQENDRTFKFTVPLVETIPVILNFRVLVYDGDALADDDDDTGDDDADDDTGDDDTGDDDTTDGGPDDDDTAADDDAAADEESYPFEAAADMIFVVSSGAPAVGD